MLWPSSSAPFRGFSAGHHFPKADALGYLLSPYRAQQGERDQRRIEEVLALLIPAKFV
jgi:hypothetical protein